MRRLPAVDGGAVTGVNGGGGLGKRSGAVPETVRQACAPRAGVFDASRRDTVLDLGDLIGGRIDAGEFFAENYVTEGMRTLLTEGFRRLERCSPGAPCTWSDDLEDRDAPNFSDADYQLAAYAAARFLAGAVENDHV